MKRLPLALCLSLCVAMLAPSAALAFKPAHHADAPTIAILQPGDEIDPYVIDSLRKELRDRGLDSFETPLSLEDAAREEPVADYYVDIVGSDTRSADYGGVDIGGRDANVSLALLVSRFGTEVRLYDARTMELVAHQAVAKRSRAVLPTAIGLGGLYAYIGVPLIQRAQYRGLARAASRDAASFVTAAINGR
jgi:hypothetical protein